MKRVVFSVLGLLLCCGLFSGCIKDTPYVITINPYLTANIGTYDFTALTVAPSTLDTQMHDSATVFVITAASSDVTAPHDRIILTINDYKGEAGVYSIVQSQASAIYEHSGTNSVAAGGIVAITKISGTSITGYFSFNTYDGITISNGAYNVGLP
jgi:hypothetical protein